MDINKINAIIVDDEEQARDVFERLLQRTGDTNLIGKASNADDGLEMILSKNPDIAFLDVQMPGKDGFELVREMKKFNLKTTVVFVTAHIEYAVNALKVAAFDYLLKPVALDELKQTIDRFKNKKKQDLSSNKIDLLLEMLDKNDKICFNTRTGYIYISPKEIVYCQADVNYTEIFINKERKEVVTINIGKIEELLPKSNFHRLSRSHLINTNFLAKADRKTKTCELYKDNEKFVIPAPPKQIRLLEKLIHQE